ncbi:MAG: hypothetical protein PHT31_05315 [Candidatus Omnitrophica bacterium]|nr:hypothetical protein [Candidatus Omnitrophota bacterium]MDD5653560.1 hypothetical protein [Candidatus Omnitrophota bacterium]
MEQKVPSLWQSLTRSFPWSDMIFGFLVPKIIFLYGLNRKMPFFWGAIALIWCVGVFLIEHVKVRKVNVFAVLAVLMILIRVVVVIAQKDPKMYLILLALDNILIGAICLLSLFFRKSAAQFFAEGMGVHVPEKIKQSQYYDSAWRIVTAVIGLIYMLFSLALVLLKTNNLSIVGQIDMFASWPLLIIVFIFCIQFPKWYWRKYSLY